MEKTYTFHMNGMHCNSCVLTIENELGKIPAVTSAAADPARHSVEVAGDFGDKTPESIAAELSGVLAPRGYSLSVEKQVTERNWREFTAAIPIALAFAALFVILQKIGLINLINTSDVSYGTAFGIGIIASLSSCMAVVGGLVLSMSATFAKEGDRVKPQALFHIGRLVAFFFLGGAIGLIGSAFTLSTSASFALSFLIGIVMLILGINLLDVFPSFKKLQPSMPKSLSKHALGISELNHTLTPLFVGIATFFLPCGFTQSMQLYTLSTGSFMKGGLTMLSFAAGTFPVLALVSFSSLSIQNSSKAGVFFKSAGLIVILFAVFNILNSLVVLGALPPLFDF